MQLRTLQTIDGLGSAASNTVILAVPVEMMGAVKDLSGAIMKMKDDGNKP
jgi:hypothetical protein